jgi:hypothetical protein
VLRACVLAAGIALLIAGIVVIAAVPNARPAGVEAAVFGALILISMAFEQRYNRRGTATLAAGWEDTGERFIDPTSGKLVEVRYNRETGERAYREIDRPT